MQGLVIIMESVPNVPSLSQYTFAQMLLLPGATCMFSVSHEPEDIGYSQGIPCRADLTIPEVSFSLPPSSALPGNP